MTPSALVPTTVGTAYSQTLTASGGIGSYTFSVASGALPPGTSLSADGLLSGTPSGAGSFSFNINVQDTQGSSCSSNFPVTWVVNPPAITLLPPSIPAEGVFGIPYVVPFSAIGGTPPFAYTLLSGALPSGLSLSHDGILSGTSTATGTFNFTVQATDSSAGGGPFSTSTSYTLTVGAARTGTTLTSSANPSLFSHGVIFTATVAPVTGNLVPAGEVNFSVGGSAIPGCAGVILSAGAATCTVSTLQVGTHTVQASYLGDGNTSTSDATLSQVVDKDTTTMTLAANPNPAGSGQTVTLTATVYGDPPSGTVTFYDGTTVLGASQLAATGPLSSIATLTVGPLPSGTHSLSASYAGDANNQASTSSILALAVNSPVVAAPIDRWAMLLLAGLISADMFRRLRCAKAL